MVVRNALFDRGVKRSVRAAVPVVSVGNLTMGGTGKTPAVEYVARFFRERDRRVAVLSRGYGGGGGRNDEALVLEENLPDVPHLQGPDRAALAQTAVEELESDVLVLDDGFQHRRLRRDLDLVLVDATNPWGYGWVFPRGLLREPQRGLRRADVVLMTRCDQVSTAALAELRAEVGRLVPGKPIVESTHAPRRLVNSDGEEQTLDFVRGTSVAAVSGIGNPAAFTRTLTDLGATVVDHRIHPDHHAYTRADVDALRRWAGSLPAATPVLTTQKDLVKLRLTHLGPQPLWAVQIALWPTTGRDELDRRLAAVLA
jgi:tetraacyldisaccharide 4'-kinase